MESVKTVKYSTNAGYTLVELMLVVALAGMVIIALYTAYEAQQRSYVTQNQVTEMQQNLRVAVDSLGMNLRRAGYDPTETIGVFGLVDIRNRDLNAAVDTNGNGSLQFTADREVIVNGVVTRAINGVLDGNETFTYSLYDYPVGTPADRDGILDLGLNFGGGRQLIAESIEELRIAYAFDTDGDGNIELSASGFILWAIDSDNDNVLDTFLDTNDDGVIDINDTAGGDVLTNSVGITDASPDITEIRSIKIWLLTRAKQSNENFYNSDTYIVGDRRVTPNDNARRRLMEFNIYLRNI